jgi:DNA-binding IclR family transcriptional regulator
MTQAQRVLDYLWSIAPGGATNRELAMKLGISSHQTVYMLTQQLVHQGLIRGQL